jgi:hypothetical protein
MLKIGISISELPLHEQNMKTRITIGECLIWVGKVLNKKGLGLYQIKGIK